MDMLPLGWCQDMCSRSGVGLIKSVIAPTVSAPLDQGSLTFYRLGTPRATLRLIKTYYLFTAECKPNKKVKLPNTSLQSDISKKRKLVAPQQPDSLKYITLV